MSSLRSMSRYFLIPPLQAVIDSDPARLIDLSLKGLRVETTTALPVGSRVRFRVQAARVSVDVVANVVWSQIDDLSLNDSSDRYLSGMTFDETPREIGELIQRLLEANVAVAIEDNRNADRYRIAFPLTGSFGSRHASLIDLSINGARLAVRQFVQPGTVDTLAFQVDSEMGPIVADATVAWCLGAQRQGFEAGLKIPGHEDALRLAIHRLCVRNEARVDLHSLRRKFDSLRTAARTIETLAS
jgi:hypothetical protein